MNKHDWKYIFKRVLVFFIIFVILSFMKTCDVHAYVTMLTDPTGTIIPYSGYDITNVNANWTGSGVYQDNNNPLMVSINNYWYGSGLYGNHLIVSADVYVGIKSLPTTDAVVNNYLNSTYDVMKAINLRCGIGENVGDGYDSTYVPEVTNFSTDYQYAYVNYSGQWLYHLTFTYKQQINPVNINGSNMSCWFVRNPGNGFFAQSVYYYNPENIRYYTYTSSFQFSVTNDPNTAILQDIVIQNQTIINQNQQIVDNSKETNDLIKDDNVSGAESKVNELINNSAFQDNSGIQAIINAPLNFINGLTNVCSPISLTIPFINANVTIPCIKQELTTHVPTIVPVLSTAINGFIIYRILLDLVFIVKNSRNPDDDRIEVLDL